MLSLGPQSRPLSLSQEEALGPPGDTKITITFLGSDSRVCAYLNALRSLS